MGEMKVHLLGVAGAGMAPLAGLLRQAGHDVSGSDVAFDPPMGPRLEAWGVRTLRGTDPSHLDGLDAKRDVVVVGNVCRRDHPLAVEAERRGLRRVSMPTALRELVFRDRPVIAVSGTHGKTTTTAIVASILGHAGLDPGYLIGGLPVDPIPPASEPSPFALGRTTRALHLAGASANAGAASALAPFVVEGDEYDSAFFEKVPKVWGYAPRAAILTSIEHDHVDIYPDPASYRAAFAGLLERLPSEAEGGLLIANAADAAVVELVTAVRPTCRVVYFAASDASGRPFPSGSTYGEAPVWTASEAGLLDDARVQPFDLFVGPSSAGRFGLGIFGAHNVGNALAAIALCVELFGLRVRDVAPRLASFRGVQRRQQRLVDGARSDRGAHLYDDFAHHPTAVEATLQSLRHRHRGARVIGVYEPRSATACRAMHQQAYVEAFLPADVIILAPLGRTTLAEKERLDLDLLAKELRARGKKVELCEDHAAVIDTVDLLAEKGDVVVAMSNGAFGGVTAKLVERLA